MYISEDRYASIKLLKKEFAKLGYSSESVIIDDQSYTRFVSPQGKIWLTRDANISYPVNTPLVARISNRKDLATSLAKTFLFPAPETVTLVLNQNPIEKAIKFLNSFKTIIIKPLDSSLSNGLTLNISNTSQLNSAFLKVKKYSGIAVAQQQVYGQEVRFTVIDGKVKAALLRKSPSLTGDGVKNIGQLLEAENSERRLLKDTLVQYPQLDDSFFEQTVDFEEVLPLGRTIMINKATMISKGASVYNVQDTIHPTYINKVESLVSQIGAKFIVVDVMIHEYTVAATNGNYNFIEFNIAPVLKLYYSCRDGKHYNILNPLVRIVDRAINL